ncbi:elongation of very long chain fatty acids protein 2 isoform X2 [Sarcophilus harrisii]|uniref:elongation of very long chain fatty acids protein 2 isoform X2 n=1 Tax=Sarcophilus harrisii TaxID=9305 RepID=UPI001301BC08|nr:elongation of very long chain fatty acids protein 2 isoform X2 [Sarcophilus harrisii]
MNGSNVKQEKTPCPRSSSFIMAFFYSQEQLIAFDNEVNAFLDNMFGPRDARVRGWLMLDSYLPTFFLTVIYLLSIWLGNKYMKNRPALSLRGILIFYNLGITLLSLYMLVELVLATWEGGYNLQCQNLVSAGEADIRVARVLWWYYFSKLIEFMDTIFFVLRKKTSQITFLHVYHHTSMFNIWWCVLNWIPCGQSFFWTNTEQFYPHSNVFLLWTLSNSVHAQVSMVEEIPHTGTTDPICANYITHPECSCDTLWFSFWLSHLPVFLHAHISHLILKFLCSDIPEKASATRYKREPYRKRNHKWFSQSSFHCN